MGMLKALGLKGRRVPVFEQCVDNIVGIAYAMYLLDNVQKGDLLESTTVGDMAHKPAYFIPDSMSVWNLLGEFCIRKVNMVVVLNEDGGTVGEEVQKKTGYIVMQAEGIYDVDANTCIDQLSEDLNIKMPEHANYLPWQDYPVTFIIVNYALPSIGKGCIAKVFVVHIRAPSFASTGEGHQYEMVAGFICEAFGYIPRTGESTKVILYKENQEENEEHDDLDLTTRN
ncbi:hypothetical protein Pint_03934 [Pistacia integerrima]|uniref:Uncharacterized protein n=1 Tax=Pistacia integerrima TaxID=434235 RepID=A0ACC0Z3I9_9ROSI|nr:hypothetical protein Pint_03934 [Pistacia integerrima]